VKIEAIGAPVATFKVYFVPHPTVDSSTLASSQTIETTLIGEWQNVYYPSYILGRGPTFWSGRPFCVDIAPNCSIPSTVAFQLKVSELSRPRSNRVVLRDLVKPLAMRAHQERRSERAACDVIDTRLAESN
jgi:hypothetical protein